MGKEMLVCNDASLTSQEFKATVERSSPRRRKGAKPPSKVVGKVSGLDTGYAYEVADESMTYMAWRSRCDTCHSIPPPRRNLPECPRRTVSRLTALCLSQSKTKHKQKQNKKMSASGYGKDYYWMQGMYEKLRLYEFSSEVR